jgi:hypothetical protein
MEAKATGGVSASTDSHGISGATTVVSTAIGA